MFSSELVERTTVVVAGVVVGVRKDKEKVWKIRKEGRDQKRRS